MRKRALLSVSDKEGIAEFAARLQKAGYEILSTGGTQKELERAGVRVTAVEKATGFPPCFGGRVKTLHPRIAGGVLMRRGEKDDEKEAEALGIEPIDVVAVNLYPFEAAHSSAGLPARENAQKVDIELIDVGGPTLLRSAAKNFASVTVICDPADYDRVAREIEKDGGTSLESRRALAEKAFARTAGYDAVIAEMLSGGALRSLSLVHGTELRYGENPHQWGRFYDFAGEERVWTVLQEEKRMSYLNILDADAAWSLVQEFGEPTAACIKHANPSGVALHEDIAEAFRLSYDADRLSAFGVIIALNRPCPAEVIRHVIDQKIFVEVIIAPAYEEGAMKLLKERPKLRAIAMSDKRAMPRTARSAGTGEAGSGRLLYRTALGGMLVQNEDGNGLTEKDLRCVTAKKPAEEQIRDLLFCWHVVKHVKSNAVVFARDRATVGIGGGQTSRVDATMIASRKAGDRARGAVMASDAFFPFPDSVEEASKFGIAAIIQPGGSIRDEEVIARANELNIPMVVTGIRGFRH